MTATSPTRLSTRTLAASGQCLLTLEVDPVLQESHQAPGQYISVQTPQGKGYFALTNAPGEPWQLLVKADAGGAAGYLSSVAEGELLQVSAAQGKGFNLTDLRGATLVVAGGTGMAPLWPLTRALVAAGHRPRVLYSATQAGTLAFLPQLRALHDDGKAQVTLLTSREASPAAPLSPGRTTDQLVPGSLDFSDVTAFVAGPPALVEAVTVKLLALGTHADHIRRNH